MPDLAYTQSVKNWWAQQRLEGVMVNVIEFNHAKFGFVPPTICDYGKVFRFTDENMNNRQAVPVNLLVEEADQGLSTDQQFRVQVDALDGFFHQQLREFDSSDRAKPMRLKHRQYLDNNTGAPIQSPITELTVVSITSTRETLLVIANARNTPNARVGSYYELDVFPELRYL